MHGRINVKQYDMYDSTIAMCTDTALKLLDNGPAGPKHVEDWLKTDVSICYKQCILLKGKSKIKVHHRTGHEGPEGE
jgi:hypothetical protein